MAICGKPFTGRNKVGKSIPIYISKNNDIHYTIQKLHERVYEKALLRKIRYHLTKFDNIGFVRIYPDSAQRDKNIMIIPVTYYTTIEHIGSYTKTYTISGKETTSFSLVKNRKGGDI